MSNMLKVKDLKVNYGGIEALKGISFDVEQGQIVTLIGANGAGKSTTLRASTSWGATSSPSTPSRWWPRASPWCRRAAACSTT